MLYNLFKIISICITILGIIISTHAAVILRLAYKSKLNSRSPNGVKFPLTKVREKEKERECVCVGEWPELLEIQN